MKNLTWVVDPIIKEGKPVRQIADCGQYELQVSYNDYTIQPISWDIWDLRNKCIIAGGFAKTISEGKGFAADALNELIN